MSNYSYFAYIECLISDFKEYITKLICKSFFVIFHQIISFLFKLKFLML